MSATSIGPIGAGGGVHTVLSVGLTSSTNTLARALGQSGRPCGTLVTADRQTAGRGRNGRAFASAEGGLYASLLLRPRCVPEDRLFAASLAALAVCEAVECCCSLSPRIKWPNDVWVDGRKLCGILCESDGQVLVCGIGINVEQEDFPPEVAAVATSLKREGFSLTRQQVRQALISALSRCFYQPLDRAWVVDELSRRSAVLGKSILLLSPDGRCEEARAVGIDPDVGGLVVLRQGHREVVTSGEISLRFS